MKKWQKDLLDKLNEKYENIFLLEVSTDKERTKVVSKFEDYTFEFLTIFTISKHFKIFEVDYHIEIFSEEGLFDLVDFLISKNKNTVKFFTDKVKPQ